MQPTSQALTPAAVLRNENDAIDLSSDDDVGDDALEQLNKSKQEAEIFNPGPEMKPLNKASIPAWSVDHNLRMLTHRHYYGVVTTICSSATASMLRIR